MGWGDLDLQECKWLHCEPEGDFSFLFDDLSLERLSDLPLEGCSLPEEEEKETG